MSRYEPLFPNCDRDRWPGGGCMPCKKDCCFPRRRPECCDEHAVRVPVFGNCAGDMCRSLPPAAPPVTIVNPWNCCEKAVVMLSIDECGNLVVCVRR